MKLIKENKMMTMFVRGDEEFCSSKYLNLLSSKVNLLRELEVPKIVLLKNIVERLYDTLVHVIVSNQNNRNKPSSTSCCILKIKSIVTHNHLKYVVSYIFQAYINQIWM